MKSHLFSQCNLRYVRDRLREKLNLGWRVAKRIVDH